MKIYMSATELYQEILNRGFDPKAKSGRDNILYLEIKKELKCPENIGLKKYLSSSALSASDFIVAFFKVAEPFSLMYRDIYSIMKQHNAKTANESIKIHFDSPETAFDIDLDDFQQWIRVQNIMRKTIETRLWSREDFWSISKFFSMLGAEAHWNREKRFEPAEHYAVPMPIVTEISRLDEYLEIIYRLLSSTISEIYNANRRSEETFAEALRDVAWNRAESQEEREYGRNSLLTDSSFTRETVPSVLYSYEDFLDKVQNNNWNRLMLDRALSFFDDLLRNLNMKNEERDIIIESFFKILNLPFWQYRWYVYEIWTTMILINMLSEYGIELNLEAGNTLTLKRGRESILGFFVDNKDKKYLVISQRQTSVKGIIGRKAICPDIRVTENPGSLPDQTIIVVECKQRQSMAVKDLQKNIDLYEHGAPLSILNIFVNYDQFPVAAIKALRTSLYSEFQPKYPNNIKYFKEELLSALTKSNILPRSRKFDALLIDISGSMQTAYNDDKIQVYFIKFLQQNSGVRIYYFNNDLIEPGKISSEYLVQTIRNNITGGTSLSKTLMSLKQKYPDVKKIGVLTDGDYGIVTPNLRDEFDIIECMPRDMGNRNELWR